MLGGEFDRAENLWLKHHRFLAHRYPVFSGNAGVEGFVDPAQVFVAGIGVPSFCFPLSLVVPPATAKILVIEPRDVGECVHPVASVIVVEDVIHVKDEKHDDPRLGPGPAR